jgi:hypothetical protein
MIFPIPKKRAFDSAEFKVILYPTLETPRVHRDVPDGYMHGERRQRACIALYQY